MPLNKTLKAEFNDWNSYMAFLESDLMEGEGVKILACYGHDGSELPAEWKEKVKQAIPDMDSAILVIIKERKNGISLEIAQQ